MKGQSILFAGAHRASECHPLKLIDAIKAHDTHPFFVAHFIEDVFDDDARPKSLG